MPRPITVKEWSAKSTLTRLKSTLTGAIAVTEGHNVHSIVKNLCSLRDVLSVHVMERSFEPTTAINIQFILDYRHINMNPSSSGDIFLTQRHHKAETTESDYHYDTDNLISNILGIEKNSI